ncbi:DUF397 domain-containing protein [Actinophytocola sediminis]
MAVWRKSSASNSNGGDCVELAAIPGAVLVRDSKDRAARPLRFPSAEWRMFLAGPPTGKHHYEYA